MKINDVIGLIGGVAAIAGAVVAIWQAIDARRARDEAKRSSVDAASLAEQSNAAWQRIASAQEIVAQAHRPKAWGVPRLGLGDLWAIRNTSERTIVVDRIDAKPEAAQPLLQVHEALPQKFRAGELLEFYARARHSLAIRTITIVWRFDGEDQTHDSARTLDGRPSRGR
ncbi:hypothetical protein AB0O70_08585 [Microbacterium paraoxydans]|jgi:hypothetical protein|uniref:hypothetical protein n=1 Tax=Microbacterium TaxID=33882 RepID=UPI001319F24B|nr:hypothetical protein [Microbacterium sp. str. 'China']